MDAELQREKSETDCFDVGIDSLTDYVNRLLYDRLGVTLDVLSDAGYWRMMSRILWVIISELGPHTLTREQIWNERERIILSEFHDCVWREEYDDEDE